ncbi:MAG: outer membrane protein [Methylovirgula sp.]
MRTVKLFAAVIAVSVIAGPALAADLPPLPGPPAYLPPPPLFTWTGLYVGGQVGYEWGASSWTAYDDTGLGTAEPTYRPGGFIGGAHVGYNYQIGQFVAGVEGDVDGSTYSGSGLGSGGNVLLSDHLPVQGSIRGRLGVTFERALIYGTGGVAFASENLTATNQNNGASDSFNNGLVGWTVGGGVEYAVTNNWSVRVEYRYTDYGHVTNVLTNSTDVTAEFPTGPYSAYQHETDNRVQAGFSYKFDMFAPPAPFVARY